MDRNLVRMWSVIKGVPQMGSAKSIRQWMRDNPDELKKIKEVNLTGSNIEVIPPEILAFENLEKVVLYGSKLGEFPHVLESHPSFNMQNLHTDGDFAFYDGFSRAEEALDESIGAAEECSGAVGQLQKMR